MGLLSFVAGAGLGYLADECKHSHEISEAIDRAIGKSSNKTLRDIVWDYLHSKGVYTTDNEYAHELEMLFNEVKGYDYEKRY